MADASASQPKLPIEHSHLERRVDDDGITVKVFVYRVLSLDLRWQLEVIAKDGSVNCWDEMFRSEQDALNAFEECVQIDGIWCFLERGSVH